jgi:hypothetical protein
MKAKCPAQRREIVAPSTLPITSGGLLRLKTVLAML